MSGLTERADENAGPAATAVIEARGLVLGYGRRIVLRDVDLAIRPGQFWFLLGPNGSGKTTLLRALLGVLTPQAGVLELHPDLAGRRRVGVVPQRCDLNPALPTTVREFVLLGTVGARTSRQEERAQLAWALEHAGLGGLERRSYWALSGGQRQRALVARALVRRPSLLILDEPTSNLDPAAEEALLHLLTELRRTQQLTLLFVTHDVEVAARYGTHLALVSDGRVRAGAVHDLLAPDVLRDVFGVAMHVFPDPRGGVVVHVGGREAGGTDA
jgi:ABC-type cobalamin/Fe3+-siderophores transport system ATPase subunit